MVQDIQQLDGDIMILGVSGKMGPTLAKMTKRAVDQAGLPKRVIGVARFTDSSLREELEAFGIETIQADLLKEEDLQDLPECEKYYLYGRK